MSFGLTARGRLSFYLATDERVVSRAAFRGGRPGPASAIHATRQHRHLTQIAAPAGAIVGGEGERHDVAVRGESGVEARAEPPLAQALVTTDCRHREGVVLRELVRAVKGRSG